MTELLLATATASWLGILTSISPCPLATNIAAVSFIGREVGAPRRAIFGGVAYAAGRTAVYVALAAIAIAGLASLPGVSMTLQRSMNRAIGPILVLVALMLFGLLRVPSFGAERLGERAQRWAARRGSLGALLLGGVFALSFCPVSAALYFGSLIPLSLERGSWLLMPAAYGVGTALPVVLFALVIGFGSHALARSFDRVQSFERVARPLTALVFLVVGLYMTFAYTFA